MTNLDKRMKPVMAGLVPAIHAARSRQAFKAGAGGSAWMPGARPGMTMLSTFTPL
jgi:hypothetical protein